MSALLMRYGQDFPVQTRGTNGREYQFDPEAVTTFLRARDDERRAAGEARDELMAQFTIPGLPETPSGLRPSDQLALTRALGLQRQQAKEAGFLVQTTEVRQALHSAHARLRRDTNTAIRQTLRDANIPEATIRSVESRIAEAQRRCVADTQAALQSEADDDPEPTLV